jgi:hypothetical protein
MAGVQEWASALLACLPAADRARARLQMELARLRARTKKIAWSKVAWAASLAIMVRAMLPLCLLEPAPHVLCGAQLHQETVQTLFVGCCCDCKSLRG